MQAIHSMQVTWIGIQEVRFTSKNRQIYTKRQDVHSYLGKTSTFTNFLDTQPTSSAHQACRMHCTHSWVDTLNHFQTRMVQLHNDTT